MPSGVGIFVVVLVVDVKLFLSVAIHLRFAQSRCSFVLPFPRATGDSCSKKSRGSFGFSESFCSRLVPRKQAFGSRLGFAQSLCSFVHPFPRATGDSCSKKPSGSFGSSEPFCSRLVLRKQAFGSQTGTKSPANL